MPILRSPPPTRHRLARHLVPLALATGGPAVVAAGLVAWGRRQAATRTADLIVVPGCRVRPDGTPSPALVRRVTAGVDLWHAGLAPRLAISGAWREAEVGGALARAWGVPDDALVLEHEARYTQANAERLAALVGAGTHVLVVSDDFHLARCRVLFGRCFAVVDVHPVRGPAGLHGGVAELPSWGRLLAGPLYARWRRRKTQIGKSTNR